MQKIGDGFMRLGILSAAAFLSGALNGLLGTGGGMVLIFALGALLGQARGKEIFVISSCGVLVFSLVSALLYGGAGDLPHALLPRFALPAAAGGIGGAFLLERVKLPWLRRLFGALLLFAGIKFLGVI